MGYQHLCESSSATPTPGEGGGENDCLHRVGHQGCIPGLISPDNENRSQTEGAINNFYTTTKTLKCQAAYISSIFLVIVWKHSGWWRAVDSQFRMFISGGLPRQAVARTSTNFSGNPTYRDLRKPLDIIGASQCLNCEVLHGRSTRLGFTSE